MSTKPGIPLDEGQKSAVHAPIADPTNVVAGAGTGKTRVLVERYIKFLDDGVPVERLLALTFTLKAAGEMRERVRRAMAGRHPDLARRMSGAWIMNFHQFGYRFIKENAPALGIDPGVDVMSIAEFERIERVLRARFESGRIPGVPADFGGEPPPPTKLGSLFDTLMRVVHHCRGIMMSPEELQALVKEGEHPAYVARVDTVIALAHEYEAELQRRGLLDFSDMITIPARALQEDPALAAAYQKAFDHILVDEFQDTSAAQNELLRSLSCGDFSRVTVVGDKKQSIYRWRDARVENIDEFPAVHAPRLTTNYRSRQPILDLAHALVLNEEDLKDAAVRLMAERKEGDTSLLLFHPENGAERHEDEAAALGAWVDHLLGRAPAPSEWEIEPIKEPLQPHDIAVLLRSFKSSKVMPVIERVFQRRGIPFAIVGGANRVEARAMESWHAFLSLLLPGDRDVDLVAVLEAPPYEVSEASLAELFQKRDRSDAPATWERLDDARIANVTDARDATIMRDLRSSIEAAKDQWRNQGFREFLVWAIESSPLRTRLLRDGAQPATVDELLCELLDLADGLARRGESNLATFLDHLRASLDERKFREEGEAALPRNRVAIMTVHQAKGLEFPAVAVVGVVDTRKSADHFLVSRESGLYFGKDTGEPWKRNKQLAENHTHEEHMNDVEERCILYVALTRAKDHLWVSAPSVEGRKLLSKESRPWLFTELLDSARELNLAREIRDIPAPAEPRGPTPQTAQETDDTEKALKEWVDLRARNAAPAADTFPAEGVVTVAWPDLAAFARCPLQFELNRQTRNRQAELEEPDEVNSGERGDSAVPRGVDPQAFGSYVHAVLHQLAQGTDLDRALEMASERYGFGKQTREATAIARALVEVARKGGIAGPGEGTRTELPFLVRLNRLVVRGVFDRLDMGGEPVITDYKVGERSDDHRFQVSTYAWAAERAGLGSPARARVAYLRDRGVEMVDVAGDESIEGIATALDEAIASGTFTAAPGSVCATCPHRGVCEFAVEDCDT
jgi:DNA helicase-2/ATP-dependent DNA helicase PcrA